jgi:hypothetical protein
LIELSLAASQQFVNQLSLRHHTTYRDRLARLAARDRALHDAPRFEIFPAEGWLG